MILEKPLSLHKFPKKWDSLIADLTTLSPKELSQRVLKISDHYNSHQRERKSIWDWSQSDQAYLNYFFKLNFLRIQYVLQEAKKRGLLANINNIYDFGSGPGTSHVAFLEENIHCSQYHCLEISKKAIQLHQQLLKKSNNTSCPPKWIQESQIRPQKNDLVLFSYSLNELEKVPSWITQFDHIIIIEPSTQKQGRGLMELRQKLIHHNFHILAPCTHQHPCPLLSQSKKDWCHMRLFMEPTQEFIMLEKQLPIKNQNLTLSYLLASKKVTPTTDGLWRVIGDPLKEKGKSKQAICRGEEREFATALDKSHITVDFPRGALLTPPTEYKKMQSELRISP